MKATPVRLNSEADKEFDLMIQSRKQHGRFLIVDVLRFSKYFKGFERVTTRHLVLSAPKMTKKFSITEERVCGLRKSKHRTQPVIAHGLSSVK